MTIKEFIISMITSDAAISSKRVFALIALIVSICLVFFKYDIQGIYAFLSFAIAMITGTVIDKFNK